MTAAGESAKPESDKAGAKKLRAGKPASRRTGSRRSNPFRYDEKRLERLGEESCRLAGADEVGRGCLAGPLVVASVVLDYRKRPASRLKGLTDSKALTEKHREALYPQILRAAERVSVVAVSPARIDREGLHRCNLLGLIEVFERLQGAYDLGLVDGFDLRRPDLKLDRVVGGDWLSAAVGAASVVAKVTRDRLMHQLDQHHPGYGFAEHVGYATKTHQQALRDLGPSAIHRRSFSLVASICAGESLRLFDDDGVSTGNVGDGSAHGQGGGVGEERAGGLG